MREMWMLAPVLFPVISGAALWICLLYTSDAADEGLGPAGPCGYGIRTKTKCGQPLRSCLCQRQSVHGSSY